MAGSVAGEFDVLGGGCFDGVDPGFRGRVDLVFGAEVEGVLVGVAPLVEDLALFAVDPPVGLIVGDRHDGWRRFGDRVQSQGAPGWT